LITICTRFAGLLLIYLLSACSGVVYTKVNAFSSGTLASIHGSIAVVNPPGIEEVSLEYRHYAVLLGQLLADAGFTVVDAGEHSDFVAYLNYSVNDTRQNRSPTYTGVIGRSHVRRVSGYADVVVVEQSSRTNYERHIGLVIAEGSDESSRVYEVNGVSTGECGILSAVFEEMLRAMLIEFPLDDGSLKKFSVKGDTRC